jgi:DNA-directed RNA polymerase specialized sigma24 family protein
LEQVGGTPLEVSEVACVSIMWSEDLIALDDALTALAAREPRQSQVLELRFFGGMNGPADIGEVMIVAPAIVKHAWHFARLALVHELGRMERWVKK